MFQNFSRRISGPSRSSSPLAVAAILFAVAAIALTVLVRANQSNPMPPRTRRPIDSFQLVGETFLLNLRNRSRQAVVSALKTGDGSMLSGQQTEDGDFSGDKKFSFFTVGFDKSDHVATIQAYQRWPRRRVVIEFNWAKGDLYCSDFPGSHQRCN
jgi:hypothetical protein